MRKMILYFTFVFSSILCNFIYLQDGHTGRQRHRELSCSLIQTSNACTKLGLGRTEARARNSIQVCMWVLRTQLYLSHRLLSPGVPAAELGLHPGTFLRESGSSSSVPTAVPHAHLRVFHLYSQVKLVNILLLFLCTVMLDLSEKCLIFSVLKQELIIREVFRVTHIFPRQPAV